MRIVPPNNLDLPALPVWQARSFWLQLLALAAVVLNVIGVDLYAVTCELGLGCDAAAVQATGDQIVAAWQMVLPYILGIWAYFERRAPRYRLIWPWNRDAAMAVVASLAFMLMLLAAGGAQAAECAPREMVVKLLSDRYGETAQSMGLAANDTVMEVFASIDTGTWKITVTDTSKISCLIASGRGYQAVLQVAEGDPT